MKFSPYEDYSNQKFLLVEGRTSFFFDGIFELLLFTIPSGLALYVVYRILYCVLFKFKISRFARKFSFSLMLLAFILEANLLYLGFTSMSHVQVLFSFKFLDKLGHLFWLLVTLVIVLFCFGNFYMAKYLYLNMSVYFIEDCLMKISSFSFTA